MSPARSLMVSKTVICHPRSRRQFGRKIIVCMWFLKRNAARSPQGLCVMSKSLNLTVSNCILLLLRLSLQLLGHGTEAENAGNYVCNIYVMKGGSQVV